MNVRYRVANLDRVLEFIKSIPRGVKAPAMRAISTYMIGDGRHGLKHYPAYKYVTRKQAFGKSFQSDKQRRYVMAMIREGRIDPGYPHRTGNYQRSWQLKNDSHWDRVQIEGRLPHQGWPNRLAAKIGWRSMPDIISTNIKGAIRAGQKAVNDWLKTRK
jgi:hypothetical protein